MAIKQYQGKYALVQYCPVPERLEYLNIGILLSVPEVNFLQVRFARGQSKIDRIFGRQSKVYLDAVKESFGVRLRDELSMRPEGGGFEEFIARRANDVRVSRLLPVMVADPAAAIDKLFDELVGEDERVQREPRIRRKLREAFSKHKVDGFLDRPDDVDLPEYGLKISVPYGYQNGCYNLIDGMRLPASSSEGLREAGKRAMEGGLIWKHFAAGPRKRLVVVGDFSRQSNEFYHAVHDQFAESNVRLYRLDDMKPLLQDIVENADLHRSQGDGSLII